MKKIGILTYYHYDNYGTALQAYALQQYLDGNYECDAEIVDYVSLNEYVGKKLVFQRIKRMGIYIKNFSKYFTLYNNRNCELQKAKAFEQFFEKNLVLSDKCVHSIEEIKKTCEKYDAIMIGSDQTWNSNVSCWKEFLIDYLDSDRIIKLSYAPSLGTGHIDDEYVEIFKNALLDFQALSCRERGGAKYLTELLGKEVEFVLDPTLLLTPADWKKIEEPVNVSEPYMLTYFLGDNKKHREVAKKIAAEKGLKIVALPISYLEIKDKSIEKQYVGPGGFISLVRNASFVCTDSFHGTMFSINFGRDFVSFPKRDDAEHNSDNNRLYDSLDVFGLKDRISMNGAVISSSIDYSAVNAKLAALRRSSHDYLAKSVSMLEIK